MNKDLEEFWEHEKFYAEKCIDKDKEIERLNKRIEDLNIINEEHRELNGMIRKELQQKENIIKEVREICESIPNEFHEEWEITRDILEILDKGSDEISK